MNHAQSYEEQELKKHFAVMDESLAVIGNADKVLRVLARQNILLAFVKREKLIKVALGKFFQGGSDFNEACNLVYEAHVNGFQLVSDYFTSLLEQVKIYERAFGAVSISLDKCEQRLEARLREWHEKCSSN